MIAPEGTTLVTKRDLIREVPAQWRQQYAAGFYTQDADRQRIQRELDALDLETCAAEDIAAIIGNDNWTALPCDLCDDDHDEVLRLGDEPGYNARWQDICLPCLRNLGVWAAQAGEVPATPTAGEPT